MINLLPPEVKEEFSFARHNRRLLSWLFAFVLAIVGVGVITGAGLALMSHAADTYNAHIVTEKNQLASEDSVGIQKQITDMSNNINLTVKVLSQEVLFGNLLNRLGQVTPGGVILSGLSITPSKNTLDITANVASYAAATQLQENVSDPANQIFSKADLVSVSCVGSAIPGYPCLVDIHAQLATNSPFLFINSKAGGAK